MCSIQAVIGLVTAILDLFAEQLPYS